MKTFSIALGRYQVASEEDIAAGRALVSGPGHRDINTAETEELRSSAALARLQRQQAGIEEEEPVVAPLDNPPPPVTMGAGDTLVFETLPDDYATCRLVIEHADGSKHWVNLHRNSHVLASGWDDVPPPPEVEPAPGEEAEPAHSETTVAVSRSKSKSKSSGWE